MTKRPITSDQSTHNRVTHITAIIAGICTYAAIHYNVQTHITGTELYTPIGITTTILIATVLFLSFVFAPMYFSQKE